LNVHGIYDVRHTEMHTAESLVPEPIFFKLKSLFRSWKDMNHHALIKYRWQNWSKQEIVHYVL